MRRAVTLLAALAALAFSAPSAQAASGDLQIDSPQAFETPNPFKAVEAISVGAYRPRTTTSCSGSG